MSVDHNDIASSVQQAQHGQAQSHWPIIIDPYGSNMKLGQEYEVNLNPCDHIWLPTFYDPSIGLNPAQPGGSMAGGTPPLIFSGPNSNAAAYGSPVNLTGVGMNVFDVLNLNTNVTGFAQSAPIFSLRFNSINAPWLLWSLSDLLSSDQSWNIAQGGAASDFGSPVGRGDVMRSITGPIARMWVKYLQFATIWSFASNQSVVSIPASRIVLLSSLGFNQVTQGAAQMLFSDVLLSPSNSNYLYPQLEMPVHSVSNSGGGYVTPQLNSLEKIEAAAKGLSTTVTAEGVANLLKRF